jgi:hypothetical protein
MRGALIPALLVVGAMCGLLATAVLAPAPARAQACAEGRVASEATAGRCCWPGQVWAAETGSCSGAPVCPSPFVAHGETCVVVASAVPEAPPLEAQVAPRVGFSPSPYAPVPAPAALELEEEPELSIRHTLVASGAAGAFATWTATASLSVITVGWSPLHLVPIIGPLIYPAIVPSWNATGPWIYGAVSFALQVASWAQVIVGLVDRRPVRARDRVRLDAGGLSVVF